jgi:hypothetical protein
MLLRILPIVLCLVFITGCDKIKSMTGTAVADPKELDAQAIGFACRFSKKTPEACMKENETFSPTHILSGWKSADADIKNKIIDTGISGSDSASASAVRPLPPAEGKKPEVH